MSQKKVTSIEEVVLLLFFVASVLTGVIKGCNNATKDERLDPADFEKLK